MPCVSNISCGSEKDLRIQETSIVHRLFGGYYRSQVKCCTCQYESNTYDCFLDLSLVSDEHQVVDGKEWMEL